MRKALRQTKPATRQVTVNIRNNRWGKGRTLSFSHLTASVAAGVFAAILLAGAYFSYNYLQLSYDRAHIAEMKDLNHQQARQVEIMQAQLEQLKTTQEKISAEHSKLKKAMGYDPNRPLSKASPSRGGQGGSERDDEQILPLGFSQLAGELTEESSITAWENSALQKLWENDPQRFLSIPSEYPVATAEVSSDFGARTNPFRSRRAEVHHGVDLTGDVGTEVYAAGNGTVVFAAWDAGYGRLIKIDHGNGLVTWYGHNYRMLVKKGQEINRGDKIALMGSSGRSTGPHVHFAIQKDGEFISPWQYLP